MPGVQRNVSDRFSDAFLKLCGRTRNLSRHISAAAQEDEHWLHTTTQALKIHLRTKQAEALTSSELLADSTLGGCTEGPESPATATCSTIAEHAAAAVTEAESAAAFQLMQLDSCKLLPVPQEAEESLTVSPVSCPQAEQCSLRPGGVDQPCSQPAEPQQPCTPDRQAGSHSLQTDNQAVGLISIPQELLQAHLLPLLSLQDLARLACSSSCLQDLVLSADANIWVKAASAADHVPKYPKLPRNVPEILSIMQGHWLVQRSLQRGEPVQIQHLSPKARHNWSLAPDGSFCAAVAADRQHLLLKMLPDLGPLNFDMEVAIISIRWHVPSPLPSLVIMLGDEPCMRQVCIFDVSEGAITHDFALPWSKGSSFSWSPGAEFLLFVQKHQTCLIRVASGQEYKLSCPPPQACIWSPDASQIALKLDTGRDRRIVIWSVTDVPVVLGSIAQAAEQVIAPLAWAGQDCKRLLVKKTDRGSINVRLVLCEMSDRGVRTQALAALSSQVSHIEVSHNGAAAAALIRVGRRFQALVWDVEQCRRTGSWLMDAQHVSSMAFSPCDQYLAVAFARIHQDFSIAVHHLDGRAGLTFIKVQQPLPECSRPVLPSPSHVCWTPDQKGMLCTIRDGTGWHHGVLVSFGV